MKQANSQQAMSTKEKFAKEFFLLYLKKKASSLEIKLETVKTLIVNFACCSNRCFHEIKTAPQQTTILQLI